MARRKITFVIVEGPSDAAALSVLLEKAFSSEQVHVHVVHGDITTQRGVSSANIIARIASCVKEYASSNHFGRTDFMQIIHIVDSDGVYASDDDIIEDPATDRLVYSETSIAGPDRQRILERNKLKRSVLNRIVGCGRIWNIPYGAYYMSCNLDHVLHGKMNSSNMEKERDALDFATLYKDNVGAFVRFMRDSDFSVIEGYKESWDFIKADRHSLERHSNFGICLGSAEDASLNPQMACP